jgi:hypothetical protein
VVVGTSRPDVIIYDDLDKPHKYALWRHPQRGPAWFREGGKDVQELGREVEIWDRGWFAGMGETIRVDPRSVGYGFTEHWNMVNYGFARPSGRRVTKAPSQAPSDAPTYFIEEGSAIFMYNGRYSWRMTISSNVITVTDDGNDAGAAATAGQPAKFEGAWFIPLGGSVVFDELTDAANNTYTAADGGYFANAFTIQTKGSTAYLTKGINNTVAQIAASPRTGTWGDDFEVGDSTGNVTNLVDTGIVLFVTVDDGGVWRWDSTGVASRIPTMRVENSDQGSGLIAMKGTEMAITNHAHGLLAIEGDAITQIGPDTFPTNQELPNVTLEPYRLDWYESAIASDDWAYHLGRVTEGGTTRTYIFAENIQGGILTRGIWHSFDIIDSACRGLFIDSQKRLWTQDGTNIGYWQLGKNGSPEAGRDSIGVGAASQTHRIFFPVVNFGSPLSTKNLMVFEIKTRGIDANFPIQLQVARDGGSLENVGDPIETSGVQKRYWDLGYQDEGFDFLPVLSVTSTSSFAPATDDPQLWAVALRLVPRPSRADKFRIVIDPLQPYADGTPQVETATTIIARFKGLEEQGPVRSIDPQGKEAQIIILNVQEVEMKVGKEVSYLIEVEAEEFKSA